MAKDGKHFVPPTRELALLAQNPSCARLRVAVAASDGLSALRLFARRRGAERPEGESALATRYGARFESKILSRSGSPGTLFAQMQELGLLPQDAGIVDLRDDGRADWQSRLGATRRYISEAARGKVRAHFLIHPALEFDPRGARWPIVPDALVFSTRYHGFRPIEIKSFPYLGGRSGVDGLKIALLQVAAASLALEEEERALGIRRPQRGSFGRATLILADPGRPWRPAPLWDVALGAERDHLRAAVIPALRDGLWRVDGREVEPEELEALPAHFRRECHRCPAYRACRDEARQRGDLAVLGDSATRLAGINNQEQLREVTRNLARGKEPSSEEERRLRRALRIVRTIRAGGAPSVASEEEEEGGAREEVEILLRLEAASRDRAVLTRGIQETPLADSPAALSLLLCPYENRLWGYALAVGEAPPEIVLEPDPRGPEAERRILCRLEEDLLRILSEVSHSFPQIVVSSRAEAELFALISARCHPKEHARLKAILAFLLDRAEEDLSATLLIATLLLHRQFRAGQPPQDDLHLGVALAWAEAYFSGDGAWAEAREAERLPIGPRLSPEEEDEAAQVFGASDEAARVRALARTEEILRAHLSRGVLLTQKAVALVRRLALPTPAHHVRIVERSRESVIRLLERLQHLSREGFWFSDTSPYFAARSYLERVAGRQDLEFWSREGDLRAALEAEDAGLGEPACITAIDRQEGTILFTCRRRTSRLREGDHLALRGFAGRLSGVLREIRTPAGGARQLLLEITSGQRLVPSLATGREVFLHPTSLAAMAYRKRSLLRESKTRLPWLFDPKAALPPAIPRATPSPRTLPLEMPPTLMPAIQRALSVPASSSSKKETEAPQREPQEPRRKQPPPDEGANTHFWRSAMGQPSVSPQRKRAGWLWQATSAKRDAPVSKGRGPGSWPEEGR